MPWVFNETPLAVFQSIRYQEKNDIVLSFTQLQFRETNVILKTVLFPEISFTGNMIQEDIKQKYILWIHLQQLCFIVIVH